MKRTYLTSILSVIMIASGFALPGCGDSGPTGTVQPPQVENTAPMAKGKVVEPASNDEK